MEFEARPWRPQDLLDDLQELIGEEPDNYMNTRRTTLCMARDYLKAYFSEQDNPPLTLDELREMDGEPVWWWNTSSKPVCTICSFKRMRKNPVFINFDFTDQDCTDITKYEYFRRCGYKPYRRKPEEGMQ